MNVADLDHLKSRLDARRPLDPAIVRNLRDDLIVRWTYHSNAIEGNSLTLRETKVVLEGVTVGGKRMTDHLEAINHRDAILMLEELVQKRDPLNEWQIQSLHQLILRGIDDDHAGVYRTVNVRISGAEHTPPEALRVGELMEAFIRWLQTEGQNLHPVIRAARVHSDFVKIHPFTDGNGRTARLLMNLELLKSGWPPVILPVESRLPYYEALDAHHVHGDFGPFTQLMIRLVKESFQPYWFALGVEEPTGT
jgi:Fic family protein